ncbi:hypothetical protein CVT26_006701 [Gymnopilus dilepis]|uniref:Uncharacterized protein n=1 Tax=Gymnopilus dilepis TaxID=231916 RepID=A0A409WQA4_9AGAR|nr:hypothetical protein CVT26_006701 [Gymnopilus dilepis]
MQTEVPDYLRTTLLSKSPPTQPAVMSWRMCPPNLLVGRSFATLPAGSGLSQAVKQPPAKGAKEPEHRMSSVPQAGCPAARAQVAEHFTRRRPGPPMGWSFDLGL